MNVYTAASIRAAEAPLLASLPEGALMQRAAYGLYMRVLPEIHRRVGTVYGSHILLLVGAGNNGGDTLWAGSYLRSKGAAVTVLLLDPEHTHAAGLAALRAAHGRVISVPSGLAERAISPTVPTSLDGAVPASIPTSRAIAYPELAAALRTADLALDGIVGIGGHGPLREPAATVVAALESAHVPIVSVDIPSGIDPDTGVLNNPHVHPVATVTFGALKPCHVLAAPNCGRISLVDIGLDLRAETPALRVVEDADVAAQWPIPTAADNKYTTGVVGVCAGSSTYPGAALLAVSGAAYASSAMVRYAGSATELVVFHLPDTVCTGSPKQAGAVDAWAAGPGMGTDEGAYDRLSWLLKQDVPLILDADAITLLTRNPELMDNRPRGAATLLTPHTGEFLRLCATYPAASHYPLPHSAADIAQMGRPAAVTACRKAWENQGSDLSILLKGRATYIAGSGGVFAEDTGSSWAATPGSGDVLTGLIGATVAHGAVVGRSVEESAAMAVRVHSRAALLAARGGETPPAPEYWVDEGVMVPHGAPVTASQISRAIPAALRALQDRSAA